MLYSENDYKLALNILNFSVDLKENENILIQLNGIDGIGLAWCYG